MKVEIKVVFDIDTSNWFDENDKEAKDWFYKDMLIPKNSTTVQIWSNEVGDEIASTNDFEIKIIKP